MRLHFLLGMVQRQRAYILAMHAKYFETYCLHWEFVSGDYSEACVKVCFRVEIFGISEFCGQCRQFMYAVERECTQCLAFPAVACDIPSLLEHFHAIGLYGVDAFRVAPIALMYKFYFKAVAHSLNDRREILSAGRNLLEQDATLEMMAFVDEIVYGKCVEQPVADAATFNVIGILDVIVVSTATAALDVDVERVFYRVAPIMKCAQRNLSAVAVF